MGNIPARTQLDVHLEEHNRLVVIAKLADDHLRDARCAAKQAWENCQTHFFTHLVFNNGCPPLVPRQTDLWDADDRKRFCCIERPYYSVHSPQGFKPNFPNKYNSRAAGFNLSDTDVLLVYSDWVRSLLAPAPPP